MNIKGFIQLVFLGISRNTRRSIINILLIAVCVFVLVISDILVKTSNNTIESNAVNVIGNREITITITIGENKPLLNIDEHIEVIKSIPNIIDAYPYYKSVDVQIFEDEDQLIESNVILKSGTPEHFPKVTEGQMFDFNDQNVAIIPSQIPLTSNDNGQSSKLDGRDYIGEELTFKFTSQQSGEEVVYKAIVAGVYEVDGAFYRDNAVFIPLDDLYKCLSLQYGQEREKLFQTEESLSIIGFVDHYKNVDNVVSLLTAIEGYKPMYIKDVTVDTSSFEFIASLFNFMFYIILGVLFIMISLFLRILVGEKVYEIALFKTMGYRDIHIFSMIFYETIILVVTGYMIGLIVALPAASQVIYPLLQNKFSNTFMKITIIQGDLNMIKPLVIILVLSFLSCIITIRRTTKISPCLLMGDSQE